MDTPFEHVTQDMRDGFDADGAMDVMSALEGAANTAPGPKLKNLNTVESAYADWLRDKSPASMSRIVESVAPTINSEIMRYSGPKALLRSRAKILAVKAVKTFNPMSGTKLTSWIVTNLQPLARYSVKQRDIKIPEVAARQAAEVNSVAKRLEDENGRDPTDEEIADEMGITVKRVRDVRRKAVASVSSGMFDEQVSDEMASAPGVVTPSKVPFAVEAVYHDLSDMDRFIFDSATGMHGAEKIPAIEVARRLGISPAAVSQHGKAISEQVKYVVENA